MPTLDFKGKQHIYAHHLTVPYRTLVPDAARSLNPAGDDDNLIMMHGARQWVKAPTPAVRSVSTAVYDWSSTAPLLPQMPGWSGTGCGISSIHGLTCATRSWRL